MECPQCGKIGEATCVEYCFRSETAFIHDGYNIHGCKKYKCKKCGRSFTENPNISNEATKSICIALYNLGFSIGEISKALNLDRSLLYIWKNNDPTLGGSDDLFDIYKVIVEYGRYVHYLPKTPENEKSRKLFNDFFKKNKPLFERFKETK